MKYLFPILLLVWAARAEASDAASVFDTPLNKAVAQYGAGRVSCYYYSGFMVKEVDAEEKGAEALSITPVSKQGSVGCHKVSAGEKIIDSWKGYFAGVKGRYVFFTGDDGRDGGYPFAIFDSYDGRKIVEDNIKAVPAGFAGLEVAGDALVVRYTRAYRASCSFYADEAGCWETIKKETDMATSAVAPDCRAIYEAEITRTPGFAEDITKSPSMVGYEVEVRYSRGKSAFTALPGGVSCWLVD